MVAVVRTVHAARRGGMWSDEPLAAAARPPRKVASDDATTAQAKTRLAAGARKVLGWPKRWKLDHAFLWEYSYNRLKLA